MLNSIKSNIKEKKLQKLENARNVKLRPFDEMKSIALVYELTEDQNQLMLIRKFVSYLKEFDKKVYSLIFIQGKDIPDQYTSKIDLEYYCSKDISPFHLAKSSSLVNFIQEDYDLLIDCSILETPEIEGIVRQSNSKLKIGANHLKYSSSFDIKLIIDSKKELKFLFQNIDNYITKLK